MAKTNWTMHGIVKPEDLNQLGEEINEALDTANDAETPQGAQAKADAAEQSAKDYADTKISEIPAPEYPVTSVNGQSGDVELTATDVGAETPTGAQAKVDAALQAAKDHTDTAIGELPAPPVTSVAGRTGAVTLTKADVGLSGVDNVKQATKSEFDAHIGNINNPHSVTKEQVGLDNVPNYGIASQTQAEAGADNATFMTPQSARQAIDARTRYGTTTGTGTAYILTLTPALSSLYTGIEIKVKMHTSNTGTATLNINGLGAKSLRNNEGATFGAGDLEAGRIYTFVYDGANFTQVSGGGDYVRIDFDDYYFYREKRIEIINGIDLNSLNLSRGKTSLAAAPVGFYLLIAGGSTYSYNGSTYHDSVEIFDENFVKSNQTLATGVSGLAATYNGKDALFGGGRTGDYGYMMTSSVSSFDRELVRSNLSLSASRSQLVAASVNGVSFFGGGSTENYSSNVDAFNLNLTRLAVANLSVGRYDSAATHVGNYVIFGGGNLLNPYDQKSSSVDAYNSELVKVSINNFSSSRSRLGATKIGNYGVFGGGLDSNNNAVSNVDVYDDNLVRTNATSISGNSAATSVGLAIFAGSDRVYTMNENLVRGNVSPLGSNRISPAAAANNEGRVFFGGGGGSGSESSMVDTYLFDYPKNKLWITIGSKYNFGEGEKTAITGNLNLKSPITGYIKLKKGVLN